jgi:hypothetical protein
MPEHEKQQAPVADLVPASLRRLNQPLSLREVRCFRSLTLTSTRPPFFPFLVCLLFCREFGLLHAPETRMNRGGAFLNIYKRDHFVESIDSGFLWV